MNDNARQLEEILCTFDTPVNLDSLFIAVENSRSVSQVPSKIDVYVATSTGGWALSGSLNFSDATSTRDFPNHFCTRKITSCLDVTKVLLRLHPSHERGDLPFCITHLKPFGKAVSVHHTVTPPSMNPFVSPPQPLVSSSSAPHHWQQPQQQLQRSLPPPYSALHQQHYPRLLPSLPQEGGAHHGAYSDPGAPTITFPNLSHQQAFGGDGHGQSDSHRYGLLPPRPAPLAPLNKPPQRHARTAASDDPRIAQRGNIPFTSENSTLRHRAAALLREQQIINNVNPELSRHPSAILMDTHRSQDGASYSRNSSETTSQYVHTIDECQRQLTRKKASAIEVDDLETAEKCHDLLTNLSSLRSLVADLDMRKRHAVGVDDYRTAKECKARLLVAMEKVENIQQEMRKRAEPPQERVLELFSGKPPTLLSNAPTAASSQFPMTDDGVGEVNYKGLDNASETSSVGPSVSVAMHGIESPSQPMPAQQPLLLEQQKAISATIISNPAQEPLSPTPLTSRMSACGSERHNSENRRLQEHPHTTVDLRRVNYDDTAAVVPARRPRTVDAVAIDAPGTIGILEAMPLSSFPVLTQLNDETPIPLTFPTPRDMLPAASISMLDQSQFCHASPSTSSLLLFRKLQEEDTRSSTSVAIRSDGSSSSSTAAVKKAHKAQPLLANLKKKVVRVDVELSSNDTRHRPSIPDPSMVTRENTGNFSRRVSEADIEVNGKEHSSTIRWNKQEHPMMAFVDSFVKTAAADSSSAAPIPPDVMIAEALAGVVVSKAEQEGDPLERSARSAQLVINASSITGWGLFVGTFGMDGARCLFTRAHPRVREAAVKALLDDDVVTRILSSGIVSDQRFQEALVVYISGHNAGYGVLDPVAPIFLANLQHFGNLRQLQYAKFLSPSQRNLSTLVASLASRLGETNARVRTVAFEELITTAELLLPDDNSDDEDSKVPRLEPLSGANVVESVAYAVVVNQHPDAVEKDGGGNAEGGSPSPAKSKLGLTNVNFAVNRLGVATALLGVFVEYCFWDRDAQEEYHCNTIFRVGHSPASKKNQPSGTPSLDGIFENYFPSLYPPLLVSNLVTPLLNHRNEAVRKAAVGLLAKIWYVYLAFPRIQRGEGKRAQPRSRAAIDNAVNSLKPAQKKQFDEVVKEEMSKMPSTESDSDSDAESEKDWGMTASPPSGLRERNVGLVVKKGTLNVPAAKASPNSSSSSPRVGEMTARPNGRQNGLSDLQFTLNAKRGVGLEQSHKTTTQIEAEMRAFAKTKKKTLEETLKENPDLAEDFFIGVGKDRNKAPPAQAVKSPPPPPPEVPRVDKKPEVDDDLRQRLAQRRASTRNTKVISSAPLGHHPDESPPLTPTLSDSEHEETEGHLGPSHPRTVGIHRTRSALLREKVARELEAELLQGGPLSPRYESSPESCKVKRGSAYDHAVNPLPPRRPSPEPTPGKCQFCGIEDPLLTNEDELLDHFKFECVMLSPCPLCMLAVEIREIHWHMTQDCSLRGRVHQCPKCLEAVAAADFVPHVNQNTCKKYALQDAKCPLCDEVIGPDDAKWRTHFSGSTCCKENPRSALSDRHLLHKKSNSQIGLLPAAGIDISNASQPPKKSVTFGSNTQHHASISDDHQFQEVTKEEISQEVSEL